jgi:hypothetical protein
MVMFELADCITPERKMILRGALLEYRRSATCKGGTLGGSVNNRIGIPHAFFFDWSNVIG